MDRNVWTARQVEAAVARQQRIERERHRPELFNQLVQRLSRSGAKTTTLDFEDEAGYQAFASDFARRRGISHLAEIAAGIEDYVARQLARLAGKRKELAALWERANVALGFAIERERHIGYDDRVPVPSVEQTSVEDMRYLLAPVTSFSRGVDEDARLAQLASAGCQERQAILRAQLGKIFVDPGEALALLNDRASRADAMPRRLADDITRAPAQLGRLRGSDRLIDGRAARDERNAAIAALAELKPWCAPILRRSGRAPNASLPVNGCAARICRFRFRPIKDRPCASQRDRGHPPSRRGGGLSNCVFVRRRGSFCRPGNQGGEPGADGSLRPERLH
ncbi:hypothetical protein AJ87_23990 [Rhizobium yanglingense]|nr:hypothetical protein AJ87_23990 [Rhizobium yanglingense]